MALSRAQPTSLWENRSLCCRSGQLLITSGSSVSSQSTRSPEHGPSCTACRLRGGKSSETPARAAYQACHYPTSSPAASGVLLPRGGGLLLLQQQGAHHHDGPGGWHGRRGREECAQQLLQVRRLHLDEAPQNCEDRKPCCVPPAWGWGPAALRQPDSGRDSPLLPVPTMPHVPTSGLAAVGNLGTSLGVKGGRGVSQLAPGMNS